ncbi:hypothetical protein ZWY2020_056015 [Hordeum vulgare]|nr:hypothetical protein ZWY2020_056015 [Hordeum vulgare]
METPPASSAYSPAASLIPSPPSAGLLRRPASTVLAPSADRHLHHPAVCVKRRRRASTPSSPARLIVASVAQAAALREALTMKTLETKLLINEKKKEVKLAQVEARREDAKRKANLEERMIKVKEAKAWKELMVEEKEHMMMSKKDMDEDQLMWWKEYKEDIAERKRILRGASSTLRDSRMLKSLPKLSRQELEVACEDFSNIIGSTPQTVVYKGTMKDDGPEVIDLARLDHENIAKFLGYCRENGAAAQFSWLKRMKIAISIAQGLRYLHTESQPSFAISETIGHGLTEIILMRRLTTLSTEDPPTTRWESFDQYVGVGTQIRVASLHKAMVNAPKQGSSSVFVR